MRPVSVFASGPDGEIEQLQACLHGWWRQATPGSDGAAVGARLTTSRDRGAAGLPPRHRAPLDQPVQPRRSSRASRPAAVRAAPAGRPAADRADRRTAGPPSRSAGRRRDPPEPAAARAGQLDAAHRPPADPHPGHEPAGHRIRRDRGEHRALGVPAGTPLPARSPPTWKSTPGWNCCTAPATARTTTGRTDLGGAEELRGQYCRFLAGPAPADPLLLPQPLTRPDAGHRRLGPAPGYRPVTSRTSGMPLSRRRSGRDP